MLKGENDISISILERKEKESQQFVRCIFCETSKRVHAKKKKKQARESDRQNIKYIKKRFSWAHNIWVPVILKVMEETFSIKQ